MDLSAEPLLSLLWFAELTCLTAVNVSSGVMTCLSAREKGQTLEARGWGLHAGPDTTAIRVNKHNGLR